MSKENLLINALQRGNLLNIKNNFYREFLRQRFIPIIAEDFKEDITSEQLLKKDILGKAEIIAKQVGVVAGIEETIFLCSEFGVNAFALINDGKIVGDNGIIMRLDGSTKTILKIERKILDIISRMSGIATMCYNIRKLIDDKIFISATRKTLLPYLDKKAIFIGGGLTHRLGLWDGVLIKDNHLEIVRKLKLNLEELLLSYVKLGVRAIEIEVSDERTTMEIIRTVNRVKGVSFIIMFDNIIPAQIKKIIKSVGDTNVIFEASGNITEKNIKGYINTGVDVVSMGMLTHSVEAFDLSMDIKC
jgi:nicotinate-nucleotide pyrophosphorylase (carboxylating)